MYLCLLLLWVIVIFMCLCLLLLWVIVLQVSRFLSLWLISKLCFLLMYRSVLLIAFDTRLFVVTCATPSAKFRSWTLVLGFYHNFHSPCSWFTTLHFLWSYAVAVPLPVQPCPTPSLSSAQDWRDTSYLQYLGCWCCWFCWNLLVVGSEDHLDLFWEGPVWYPSWHYFPCKTSAMRWAGREFGPGLVPVQLTIVPPAPQPFPQHTKWCPMCDW